MLTRNHLQDRSLKDNRKPVKEKTIYAAEKEKRAKTTIKPGKLDDSGSGSASEEDVKQTKKAVKKVEKAVEPTSAPAEKKKRAPAKPRAAKK